MTPHRTGALQRIDERVGKVIGELPSASQLWLKQHATGYHSVDDIPEPYRGQIKAAERKRKR
jgi:hypothetical protein